MKSKQSPPAIRGSHAWQAYLASDPCGKPRVDQAPCSLRPDKSGISGRSPDATAVLDVKLT